MKSRVLLVLLVIAALLANKTSSRTINPETTSGNDRTSWLPGVQKMPKFNMYSGYLDSGNGDQLFYWLLFLHNSYKTFTFEIRIKFDRNEINKVFSFYICSMEMKSAKILCLYGFKLKVKN